MTIKEITQYLNIPFSTFHEWNTLEHKKYELTILLLALPLGQVKELLEKNKKEETPKYSQNTRYITLDKRAFDTDLLWTTQDKEKVKISTLITIYMNRASQMNSDKICSFFGYERVKNTIEKNITDKINLNEAQNQINYYKIKKTNKEYIPTNEELENIFKNPKQRVVDYYCKTNSKEELLKKASTIKPKFPIYSQIKQMVNYYQEEFLNDKRITLCS